MGTEKWKAERKERKKSAHEKRMRKIGEELGKRKSGENEVGKGEGKLRDWDVEKENHNEEKGYERD